MLARLITAETTGEPYDAMVAVGAVVVNRVQSSDWPNTITSVINQKIGGYYQFTPVKNGYINNPPSDTAVKAAWDALYGKDPSNGAQFYFDDSSTNQWLWSKTITARIGRMVFVK
jgi:spore germination cell wall hydrolase CwlJ-like protein